MDINEKNVNININVKEGAVINVAKDNGTIISSQYTGKDAGKVEEPVKLISEEEKNRIQNLIKRNELIEAKEKLKELELIATTNSDAFFISFNLGKCYLLIAEKQEDRRKKEQDLHNAMDLLIQANVTCKDNKQEDIYEMYYIYMNICLRLGELLENAEYYKKGIELFEDNKLEKKIGDENKSDKYVLLLDYALLLDKYCEFCNSNDAKKVLEKEYACYLIIGTIEEIKNSGLDVESAYRFFVNFGRCLEKLIEYSDDNKYDELFNNTIELYNNALDADLVSLRKSPDRYGLVNNNLGNIYGKYGSIKKNIEYFDLAEKCYKKSLKACEITKDIETYYSYMSNYSRLLSDKYNKFNSEKDLVLAEKMLIDSIEKRIEICDYDGGYISKYQLAQLYLFCAKHKKDEDKANKAIVLFKDILEYFTKEYKLDVFHKVNGGLFESEVVLCEIHNNSIQIVKCIEEQIEFLREQFQKMSSLVSTVYLRTMVSTFFVIANEMKMDQEAEKLYKTIEQLLKTMELDINNYIEVSTLV